MRAYSTLQISLHWLIAAMVGAQWYTSGAIHRTHNPLVPPTDTDLLLHALHNYGGMTIGAIMLLRLGLRLRYGTSHRVRPVSLMERAANGLHLLFYVLILMQAGTGFVTSYLWGGAGSLHSALWTVLLVLIALHVSAALYHLIRGDRVFSRMLPFVKR
ncbi:MAG: cytochrome B [Rhizobiales bacterium]|nr:cytochrome B [Hyphomicrobiales bacterium]MBA69541.1 cytochrome B [Hyphomicrobiales bacterium]|tara:strand:- start:830 stop:1303 length:474 start_codon:yes stop_codon:yes gene_type:complete